MCSVSKRPKRSGIERNHKAEITKQKRDDGGKTTRTWSQFFFFLTVLVLLVVVVVVAVTFLIFILLLCVPPRPAHGWAELGEVTGLGQIEDDMNNFECLKLF